MNVAQLQESAELAIAAVRKHPQSSKPNYRLMGYGTLKTGAEINQVRYWPVKGGDFIRGGIIPEDGVLIEYQNQLRRYIKNSWYDDINTDTL